MTKTSMTVTPSNAADPFGQARPYDRVRPAAGVDRKVTRVTRRAGRSVAADDRAARPAILTAHATLPSLLHDAPRRPLRRRDGVASPAAAGGLRPPTRLGDLFAAAARLPREQAGRADHPRGDGP